MSKDLFIYGTVNVDNLFILKKEPVPGGVEFADSYIISAGGKGDNQAAMAALMMDGVSEEKKLRVYFCSQIGTDSMGKFMETVWKGYPSLDTTYVVRKDGYHTSVASIYVQKNNAENTIVIAQDLNTDMKKMFSEDKFQTFLKDDIGCVLIQMESDLSATLDLIKYAKLLNKFVVLNAAPVRFDKFVFEDFLGNSDVLIFNEYEFSEYLLGTKPNKTQWNKVMTKEKDAQKFLKKICDKLMKAQSFNERRTLIITLGGNGIYLYDSHPEHGSMTTSIPLNKHLLQEIDFKAVDTTGSGDAFVGCLTVLLMQTGYHLTYGKQADSSDYAERIKSQLVPIIESSSIVASSTVKRQGTQTSYNPYEKMEEGVIRKLESLDYSH
ncbi:hypothetical protein SNEBB_005841 [Seison nebaliae]|nr:hypothetical protein SNEBB_005841 [Seison nebaliae]